MNLIHFSELPYYLTVFSKLDKKQNTVKVEIHSRIHVNKVVEMPNGWSTEWVVANPSGFRSDILAFVIKRYGLIKEPVKYS